VATVELRRLSGSLRHGRLRLPAAVIGATLVAEATVWLLRPHGVIDPVEVRESAYFTHSQLERAIDFRTGQRWLGIGALVVQAGVLAFLVARPPRRMLALAERAGRGHPLAAGALAGAGLVTVLRLAPLPFDAIARERAVDVGLVTQSWSGWASDLVKSVGIGAAFAAAGAALFLWLMRRFPRRWWLAGSAAIVVIEVLFVWLAPVVLAPLFNRYEKLPQGTTRTGVTELARRAGVDVGEVYVVDASRRTTSANAFVTGLGHTKRVVLYDTLIDRFKPGEVRVVVAHELGHVRQHDVRRGMIWVAIVAPPAMFLVMLLTGRWSRRAGAPLGTAASLPAFALALALVAFGASVVSNQLSRRIEAKADTFALELTRDPPDFIDLEQRLAVANVADPDPPKIFVWLFGTHPPTIERIGAGVSFERSHKGAPGPGEQSRR
jgi:Zn-dependent protease with chaperone function